MKTWADQSVFYHIYPLAQCGAPAQNDGTSAPVPRIRELVGWADHAASLGCNALYLGPVWESVSHGYDTTDYALPDRRLGTPEDLLEVLAHWKGLGFRIVLDGVFHHCGREFAPFKDVREKGRDSVYRDWFDGLDFHSRSPFGDPFSYKGWDGHLNLVKFNLANPELRAYLFACVGQWIDLYGIDGLRLDAADVVDKEFLQALSAFCKSRKSDFWLMGEVVHGDYRRWAPEAGLDAVTNYEVYKGLWSSFNDKNFYEIAYSLNRQFGPGGIYSGQRYYLFADNHDVNRVASQLTQPAHLFPLYLLLFTMPGIPSLYYGSEVGIGGKRTAHSDSPLRPRLSLEQVNRGGNQDLRRAMGKFVALRNQWETLTKGGYEEGAVSSQQLAFWRTGDQPVLVAVNAADQGATVSVRLSQNCPAGAEWVDLLNPGETFRSYQNGLDLPLWPHWGRVLVRA